ncbi:methyltransferase family protein [Tamaricihabitans halophyticus]|uniref:Methyltransferase family protein n=1 Tax=Tamaricihabitans halophyticus TaxID=1262583 RepID=A0A4R2RBL7_9PSEU|nr:methyltransferase [Tamaricihabitans halophyticus]TCP56805.1 methyltransferase family protein [Tamaricihabitans halophyticus]
MTTISPDVNTAAGLLRLGNMFCDAKALLTAVDLDLFGALADGPATEAELKDRLNLNGRGLSDFLHLLVALGLIVRQNGTFANSPGANAYLVRGKQSYIGGFLLRSNHNLYPAWGRLSEALRSGEPQAAGDFQQVLRNPAILRQFIGMMDALTQQLAPELIKDFDFSAYGSVLDVGGCRGNMVGRLVTAYPNLRGHVLDLPELEPFFDEHMATMGLAESVDFHPGSFFERTLPAADIVLLGHVLHDWDAREREQLVRKAFEAVNPGGALLVYDRMLDDDPDHVENLVISLDMLLVTEGGAEYPVSELVSFATAAGCANTTQQSLGDYDTLVVCRRP